MELCKHCSKPITPRPELHLKQTYCSFKCWKEHWEPENELSPSGGIQSQIIAWGSIIGMFAFLFVVLVSIATFVVNLQYFLLISSQQLFESAIKSRIILYWAIPASPYLIFKHFLFGQSLEFL